MTTPDVVQAGQDFQDVLASPMSAYDEGLRFFRGLGMANDALHRLVADLNTYGIDYSVIGAVALNQHGYQRFTADIDLLMSAEGLEKFRRESGRPRVSASIPWGDQEVPSDRTERPH